MNSQYRSGLTKGSRPERSSLLRAHNPEVAGSNPAPAIHEEPSTEGFSRSSGFSGIPGNPVMHTPCTQVGSPRHEIGR
jgi:hypothetical protein